MTHFIRSSWQTNAGMYNDGVVTTSQRSDKTISTAVSDRRINSILQETSGHFRKRVASLSFCLLHMTEGFEQA